MTNEIKTWQDRVREKTHASFRDQLTDDELSIIGTKEMRAEVEELRAKVESLAADAKMFAWVYSKHRTDSIEMIELELRMLKDDYPTIEEVRAAVADAMAKEKA